MQIVVVGGSGDVGTRVAGELGRRGHEVRAVSRRTGVDVTTGAGVTEALTGADAVVFAATSDRRPRPVEVGGLSRVAQQARQVGAHLVFLSVVGCDGVAFPYYRVKTEAERALAGSGADAIIVRATQFHSLAAYFAGLLRRGPVALTVGDMRIQPVDVQWVAQRLADHATGPAPSGVRRAVDLAGPDVYDLRRLTTLLAEHDGTRPPRVLRLPPVVRGMRDFSRGAALAGSGAETGGRTFEEWLAAQPSPLPSLRSVPG